MKVKRILSFVLCMCTVLSLLPAIKLTTHAANQTVCLETEEYALAWRYPTVGTNSGRVEVGGSQPGLIRQTYAQLAGGAKLDKNQPMLTYQVDVPAAGNYTMKVSYRGYTQSDYYMIVSVDDTTYYKAVYSGADQYSNRWLTKVTLNLTEGRHFIRLITLPGDVSANWINVDYASFEGPGALVGIKDWTHLQSADAPEQQGFTGTTTNLSSYGPWWDNALTGYQGNSMADAAGVTTNHFTPEDIGDLGWFRYVVNVPRDGFYDMQTYLQPAAGTSGTGKVLLGLEKTDFNLINQAQGVLALDYTGDRSDWINAYGEYSAISVIAKNSLPVDQSSEISGVRVGYSQVLRIQLDNGKSYAFCIINEGGYVYSHFGADGAVTGWDNKVQLTAEAAELMNGTGVEFKLERTASNILTVTINGEAVDTYTMDGVTANNKVISVGLQQFGNPVNGNQITQIPVVLTGGNNQQESVNNKATISVGQFAGGKVTADKTVCNLGDTVTLTVTPNSGYSQKLYINDKPLLLDWKTNTYSFVANENLYEITGGFQKNMSLTPSASDRWDSSNQAHGILSTYYPNNDDSWWMDMKGDYTAISVKVKNYLSVEDSKDGNGKVGFAVILRVTMDNGKVYGFRVINSNGTYGHDHYGATGFTTTWGTWNNLNSLADSFNGDGVDYKLERTAANKLTISINGTVVETYTMEGITASNKIASIAIQHNGNPGAEVEIPFELTSAAAPDNTPRVQMNISSTENGTVVPANVDYKVGETVTLIVTPDAGYSQKLYINGEPLKLDWKTNQYSFVATENTYTVTGGFEQNLELKPSDNSRWDTANQAQGVLNAYYPNDDHAWWMDVQGEYKSITVAAKNYWDVNSSYEGIANGGGFRIALRATLDNGKSYAFSIWNDTSKRYCYNHFGGSDSATGWSGAWCEIKEKDAAAYALINGAGADFKLDRIDGNHFQLSINGTVLETYEIPDVTAEDKVVSVGVCHWGNKGEYVEIPFQVEEQPRASEVELKIHDMANGTVTAEMPVYKVGDIIELTVLPNAGYSQKLTINGEPILLDLQTGKYSFVATEKVYEIAGSFEKNLWSGVNYQWIDVRLDKGAEKWWIADLSSYLTQGEYRITVSGLMDYTGGSYNKCDMGALTVSGGMTATSGTNLQKTATVSKWGIVVGERVGVKFIFDNLTTADEVTFWINDKLLLSEVVAVNQYVAYIDPAQMTDEITIQINGNTLSRTYSVRTYANAILAGSYSETTKTLVKEMLNYGGAAQVYFQYHTERLANADLGVKPRDLTSLLPLSTTEYTFENNMQGVYFYGASLLFQERIAVRFYFSGNADGCTFHVNGETVTPAKKDNLLYVEVGKIMPQQINAAIEIKVTRGTENIIATYSPMNYLDRMYQMTTATTELKNLLSAMYYFHEAAKEYVYMDEEMLPGVITHLNAPNDLFYRNDNISNLADPFVLDNTAIDGYYYLYGTWGAFTCFRSKNLMDWEKRGDVLGKWREDNKVWDSASSKYSYQVLGGDLWAPEVVYDPDTKLYYMFFSATPDIENQAVAASASQQLMVATCTTPDGDFTPVNFMDANSCGANNVHSYSTSTYSEYFAKYVFLDPAQNKDFSISINNEDRAAKNGGYVPCIDAHPHIAPDGKKYLFWVDNKGEDRICGVEMENWLKPKWETAKALIYFGYYTVDDWKNGSNNKVDYETKTNITTTNEGPFIIERNGKYYMTYSAGNYKYNTYFVGQAVADNILGPYTKVKEADGGVMLSGLRQDSMGRENTGTGHHSFLAVGNQLYIIYHRHNDVTTMGAARNHAIDEVKWITVNGQEVMYVNGPTANFQPRVELYSEYRNIADEATVTSSDSQVNPKALNDGLLSHYKNANATFVSYIPETTITDTTTFTFDFGEAKTVKSIMVYNSRQESRIFRQIKQIKLTCLENGEVVVKYINNVLFNAEHYTTDANGKVTYVQPCSSAYAIFDEQQVISVEITVEVPAGQTNVGISEVRILGVSDGSISSNAQFKSSELEKYTIVYDGDNADLATYANQLKTKISEKYGKTLSVVSDSASAPAKYEILLGDTNRDDRQGRVMEYSVTVTPEKFRINVGGSFSAEKAIAYLCESVFDGQSVELRSGEHYQTSLLTSSCNVTEGTTARIMTANVLADAFSDGSAKNANYRAEIFAGMLVSYTPDVVGMQEVDASWSAVLDGYLTKIEKTHGIQYSRYWATYENKTNYTSLLYRTDKLQVVNSGVKVFSWWTDKTFNHSYHMRNISWAQFKYMEDGKKFIVANTHWSYRAEHAGGNVYLTGSSKPIASDELRTQCKNETSAFLSSLKTTYSDCPIFLTGDFNTSITYFTSYGWTPTSFNVISQQAKNNGTAVSVVPTTDHFDHLFGTGSYTIKRYEFFRDVNYHSTLTDHPFAYADLTF